MTPETVSDPGSGGTIAPPATKNFRCTFVSSGVETRSVGAPGFVGQLGTLELGSGSTGPVTIVNVEGWRDDGTAGDDAVFGTAGGSAMVIVAVKTSLAGTRNWRLVARRSVTVS